MPSFQRRVMSRYEFEIVNVFAEQAFGGNPLAVFPRADGLGEREMQLIARQFNLSETVFIFPGDAEASASLRIFTPGGELPFAGHPTLGAAAVWQRLRGLGEAFALRTPAGLIPIRLSDGICRLSAPPASQRLADLDPSDAAAMLGLSLDDIAAPPAWVSAGNEQLLIRLASREAVLAARPDPQRFIRHAQARPGRSVAYLWHEQAGVATVRFFFEQQGAIVEDPGTGSACANLGGWCALNGLAPLRWRVEQGEAIGRPNVLYLQVDEEGRVSVGGRVRAVAEGRFYG